MKHILFIGIALLTFGNVTSQNTSLNPFKLKLEMFSQENIKHGMEFVDKDGIEYQVTNTESAKGVKVKNGSKWRKHGVFITLYNGKVSTLKTYDYGVLSGESLTYYNGKLNFRKNYVNNLEEGTSIQYNDKEEIVKTAEYVGGDKHGIEIDFYKKKKNFEKNWVEGKLHGEILQYNEKGKLVAKSIYNNGKQVGKTIYY